MKIRCFNSKNRQSLTRAVCGCLMVIVAVITLAVDPLSFLTEWDYFNRLAKLAALEGAEVYIYNHYSEILGSIKKSIYNNMWKEYFDKTSKEKGIWYKIIQSQPPQSPWFCDVTLKRSQVVLLHRLRSGHIPSGKFAHLMKKIPSPMCPECGIVDDVQHVLIECVQNANVRKDVMCELKLNRLDVGMFHSILAVPTKATAEMLWKLYERKYFRFQQFFDMKEGSMLHNMWKDPPYELFTEVWVFNYTNSVEYLRGDDKVMKLEEIGPFKFREKRKNNNMTFIKDRGVLSIIPEMTLEFIREESVADLKDVKIIVPDIALTAMSTLAADQLGYVGNVGAYYSLSLFGNKLFRELSVQQLFWGYEDPIVSLANNLLPGWIDFSKLGILDRFYAPTHDVIEMDVADGNNKYSISSLNGSPGLKEQGFTDLNTSCPCNLVKGTYEGAMLTPGYPIGKDIPIFKKQACRVYPFLYEKEVKSEYGFQFSRYIMAKTAFSKNSSYACPCTMNCVPEGFVDISQCYYGFPIVLSMPHFSEVDPLHISYFEGMNPDFDRHNSKLHVELVTGTPISFESKIQVNMAVRTSPGNTITELFKDKVLPLIWLSLYCNEPPSFVTNLLKLRLVIAPPILLILEIILFGVGVFLCIQGLYRTWRQHYTFVNFDETYNNIVLDNNTDLDYYCKEKKGAKSIKLNATDYTVVRSDEELVKENDSSPMFWKNTELQDVLPTKNDR